MLCGTSKKLSRSITTLLPAERDVYVNTTSDHAHYFLNDLGVNVKAGILVFDLTSTQDAIIRLAQTQVSCCFCNVFFPSVIACLAYLLFILLFCFFLLFLFLFIIIIIIIIIIMIIIIITIINIIIIIIFFFFFFFFVVVVVFFFFFSSSSSFLISATYFFR